jgi:hypothetical protein
MDLSPNQFFDSLRHSGFRVRTSCRVKPATLTKGTTKRRSISHYVASKKVNGHIVTVVGDIHVIGDDTHISAAITMTSTIRKLANVTRSLDTSSIEVDDLLDIITYGKLADKLPECHDYTIL